jgi:hypothetical protein
VCLSCRTGTGDQEDVIQSQESRPGVQGDVMGYGARDVSRIVHVSSNHT